MEQKYFRLEDYFETALFNLRFVTLLAVIGSMIGAVIVFLEGTLIIVKACIIFIKESMHFSADAVHEKELVVPLIISSVDKYLLATVMLIFSMGIYELFISKIDPASRTAESRPNWLKVTSLDDLKGALGKVILMILIVTFFERSMDIEFLNAFDLMFFGIGILLVAGALFLSHIKPKEH